MSELAKEAQEIQASSCSSSSSASYCFASLTLASSLPSTSPASQQQQQQQQQSDQNSGRPPNEANLGLSPCYDQRHQNIRTGIRAGATMYNSDICDDCRDKAVAFREEVNQLYDKEAEIRERKERVAKEMARRRRKAEERVSWS